ncbi:MAG: squalene/phytoene synthase family protein, partial [Planctomycetota bacterium]
MSGSFDFNDELLHDLLARTSRTFGLAIPLLPFPAQRDVTIAYLLFRIADTIEDGQFLTAEERLAAFDKFSALLESASASDDQELALQAELVDQQPCENEDYLHLLANLHLVVQSARHLDEVARAVVFDALRKSVAGM